MNVAVVDVGSNTIRLLVAAREDGELVGVAQVKAVVGLGADIERDGVVSAAKLAEASDTLRGFTDIAYAADAGVLEVVVASPGRQARNADQLVHVLSRAAGTPVRVLSREDEGRLAFEGALAANAARDTVAVVDVGGGSSQIVVGTADGGAAWLRSVDLGSLRLSSRVQISDPPVKPEIALLRHEAGEAFAGLTPPLPKTVFAVGGTARAVKKLVGRTLGPDELHAALKILRRTRSEEIADRFGVDQWRVRALPAGIAILFEAERLLGAPLEVVRGGLREGLAWELLDRLAATAASAAR